MGSLILRDPRGDLGRCLRTSDTGIIYCGGAVYEEVGNFGYAISEREMEKVALGLGLPAVAFKGLNDRYEKGVEFERADPASILWRAVESE